jgi:hypothetical protein
MNPTTSKPMLSFAKDILQVGGRNRLLLNYCDCSHIEPVAMEKTNKKLELEVSLPQQPRKTN